MSAIRVSVATAIGGFGLVVALIGTLIGLGDILTPVNPHNGHTPAGVTTRSAPALSPSRRAPARQSTTAAKSKPAAVVEAYAAAISRHDYATAWSLGGKNLGAPYTTFVGGYGNTHSVTMTVMTVIGTTVYVQIMTKNNDGSQAMFQGKYVVQNGTIQAASIRQMG